MSAPHEEWLIKRLTDVCCDAGHDIKVTLASGTAVYDKYSVMSVVLEFRDSLMGSRQGSVLRSPVLFARVDWLGHCDMDPHNVDDWQPINKGTVFQWWWYCLAQGYIDSDLEKQADKVLVASGIKGAND